MKKLVSIAINDNLITSIKDVTEENSNRIFDHAYGVLIEELYGPNKEKSFQLNVNRVGNLMKN